MSIKNGRLLKIFTILVSVFFVSACGDECSSYSDFSCEQIQSAEYNVSFSYPSGDYEIIGNVQGLSNCGALAHSHAYDKNLENEPWSYVCCMVANGSSCYKKHR